MLTTSQIKSEIADETRQCFTRHKFKTWGDALKWMHEEEFEKLEQEAGSLGYSKLSTEILWLILLFGPNEKVDWDIVKIRSVPSLARILEKEEKKPTLRRRPRRKRY